MHIPMLSPASLEPTIKLQKQKQKQKRERRFDPSEEYRKLLEATDPQAAARRWPGASALQQQRAGAATGADDGDDVYQYLMSRERRVLDTVDRVVNDAARTGADSTSLARMPLHEILMRIASAVRSLFEDLVACGSLAEVMRVLTIDPPRRPFVGLALVLLAALICVLDFCAR